MALGVTIQPGFISLVPNDGDPNEGPPQTYSLAGASVFSIPPRPDLPTGAGGQVLSTMPQAGTPANVPPQQYSNMPQQWRVCVQLEAGRKKLFFELGDGLTGVTWANSAAGAATAVGEISAAIP